EAPTEATPRDPLAPDRWRDRVRAAGRRGSSCHSRPRARPRAPDCRISRRSRYRAVPVRAVSRRRSGRAQHKLRIRRALRRGGVPLWSLRLVAGRLSSAPMPRRVRVHGVLRRRGAGARRRLFSRVYRKGVPRPHRPATRGARGVCTRALGLRRSRPHAHRRGHLADGEPAMTARRPRPRYPLGRWSAVILVSVAMAIADRGLGRVRVSTSSYLVDDEIEVPGPAFELELERERVVIADDPDGGVFECWPYYRPDAGEVDR